MIVFILENKYRENVVLSYPSHIPGASVYGVSLAFLQIVNTVRVRAFENDV